MTTDMIVMEIELHRELHAGFQSPTWMKMTTTIPITTMIISAKLIPRQKYELLNYRPQRSCEGYVFTGVCLSTGWGGGIPACLAGGIPACLAAGLWGCAFLACIAGGIPACLATGLQGVCSQGCACSGGSAAGGLVPGGLLLGGSTARGVWRPPKADGYCYGRYASYWNTFLLK